MGIVTRFAEHVWRTGSLTPIPGSAAYYLRRAVGFWLLLEVLFWVYERVVVFPRVNKRTIPPKHPSRGPEWAVKILLNTLDILKTSYSHENFIRGWFDNAPLDQIYMGNFREIMAWAVYSKYMEDLSQDESKYLDESVDRILNKVGLTLSPGYNTKLTVRRATLDDLCYFHRTLAYYFVIHGLQYFGYLFYYMTGFRRYRHNGLAYWYRKGSSKDKKLPMAFFHGISFGIGTYVQFVLALAYGRGAAFLFETPQIAMTMRHFTPLTRQQTVDNVEQICRKHGVKQISAVGHSFGSIIVGWLATSKPHLLAQAVFIDPVCFLICLPDICNNFLYRPPKTGMDYLIYYILAREITIDNALQRHFWWYENTCLLEEVQCPVIIAVSQQDEVLPAEAVREYVEHVARTKAASSSSSSMIDLIWWRDLGHAGCLAFDEPLFDVMRACNYQEKVMAAIPSKPKSYSSPLPSPTLRPAATAYSHHKTAAGERLARDYHE